MRVLLLVFLAVPLVSSQEVATVPKPPISDNKVDGSFGEERAITVSTIFKETYPSWNSDPWYMYMLRYVHGYLMVCRKKTNAFGTGEDYKDSLLRMRDCMAEYFLKSLDGAIGEGEIDVNPYLTIVREKHAQTKMNVREDAMQVGLIPAVYKRFSSMIDTHSFKLRFYDPQEKEDIVEAKWWPFSQETSNRPRGMESDGYPRTFSLGSRMEIGRRRMRRYYRRAFPMMVAGYMIMSAFLIPLGFQFMAMIGGKALLLAKMAFIMSVFSGYKRLTSDLDYHHHGGGHHQDHVYHAPTSYFTHRSAEMPMTAPGDMSMPFRSG